MARRSCVPHVRVVIESKDQQMTRRLFTTAMLWLALGSTASADLVGTGQPFPAWSLKDHTGATVSSADLGGNAYLLWFYPAAMTPGCTAEGRGLRDQFDAYRAAGIEILGVSFDSPERNAKFVEEEGFPFRLLSDEQRVLATAVGAASSNSQSYASRISYLVGADGKVIAAYGDVNPSTHASQVLADFRTTRAGDAR
jgi:peroxiredoxin Q/BCP